MNEDEELIIDEDIDFDKEKSIFFPTNQRYLPYQSTVQKTLFQR